MGTTLSSELRSFAAAALRILALLGSVACAAEQPGAISAAVVYGDDDRRDWYTTPNEELRALARAAVVTILNRRALDLSNAASPEVRTGTFGDKFLLCPGEPFSTQPAIPGCTGVLIDDELVLTAGHCVEDEAECRAQALVFDYYFNADGVLAGPDRDAVFTCRRLVARERSADGSRDFAVIQLDRPVSGERRPVELRDAGRPMEAGDPVTLIAASGGTPLKIDAGGRVTEPRAEALDFFRATVDAFSGASGGGVFDGDGHLAGILVRGNDDFVPAGDCYASNTLSAEPNVPAEDVAYAGSMVAALCATGFASARLCGASGECGDDACSPTELTGGCTSDCPPAECGNGLCEGSEPCPADCAIGPPAPPQWTCSPAYYGARDGCDCGCGASDPDCDGTERILGCPPGETCVEAACRPTTKSGGCMLAANRNSGLPSMVALLGLLGLARRRATYRCASTRTCPARRHRRRSG